MKKFISLFKQDLLLSWRNGLILVTGITLVLMVSLYWLLPVFMPEDLSFGNLFYFVDHHEEKIVEFYLKSINYPENNILQSDSELKEKIAEVKGSVGIIFSKRGNAYEFQLLVDTSMTSENIALLEAELSQLFDKAVSDGKSSDLFTVTELRPLAVQPAANKTMLVVLLTLEVIILGFLFIAVIVFNEKKEGSHRAYRVSASGLWNYVISKALVFTLISLLYGFLFTLFTVGFTINYINLLLILLLACGLMSFLGLGVAVFFTNISEWFLPGVFVLSLNMFSVLPFQIPTLKLPFFQYFPGYIVVYAINEIIIPTGKKGFMLPTLLQLGFVLLLSILFSLWAVNRKIMREV